MAVDRVCGKDPMRIVPLTMAVACASAATACGTLQDQSSTPPPDIRSTLVGNRARLFKDPDSIRDASIARPSRFLNLGWQVCIRMTGKNSSGGDTDLTTYTVIVYDNGVPPLLQKPTFYNDCISAYYQPFPEIEGGYVQPNTSQPSTTGANPSKRTY
jgi:hypothetical protein